METEVVKFYPADAAKNPDNVLEQAIGVYEGCIILGWDKQGYLAVRSSTNLTKEMINLILDLFKFRMLAGAYDDESVEEDGDDEAGISEAKKDFSDAEVEEEPEVITSSVVSFKHREPKNA